MAKTPKAAPAGNKPNTMTDEQEQRLFASNMDKYERLIKAKKAADKAVTDIGKVIKAEHGTHGLLMIKTTIALRSDDASGEERAKADAIIKAMRWAGEPIGFQGSIFDDQSETVEERAFASGRRTGVRGEPMTAPVEYAAGDAYQEWCKGWHEGQHSILNIGNSKPATDEDAEEGEGTENTTH